MRLLFLTTQDRFFLTHVSERATFFKEKGWDVYVAAQQTSEKYKADIQNLGFKFYDTKMERKAVNPFSLVASFFRILKIYSVVHPDLCFHLGAKSIFIGSMVCKCLGRSIKIINAPIGLGFVYVSNSVKAKALRPLVDFMYKLTLNPQRSKVIIENRDDIRYFVLKGAAKKENVYWIPGAGVNTDIFKPDDKLPIVTVVMAARLIKEKGIWEYIEAAERLYKLKVPVCMKLVGVPDFGNPSSVTETEFQQIQKNPAIEYLGFCEEMQHILNNAHICCLPSYREGLPRVLVEAASSGMAIITTDTVGCREVVNGKNGVLVPMNGVNEIVNQIIDYLLKPQKLHSAQEESRKFALERFDTKIICEQTYNVLLSLIKE